jgi:hypothetical protein
VEPWATERSIESKTRSKTAREERIAPTGRSRRECLRDQNHVGLEPQCSSARNRPVRPARSAPRPRRGRSRARGRAPGPREVVAAADDDALSLTGSTRKAATSPRCELAPRASRIPNGNRSQPGGTGRSARGTPGCRCTESAPMVRPWKPCSQ